MTNEQRDSLLISIVDSINKLQSTLNDFRAELKADIKESEERTKAELRTEIQESAEKVKAELRAEIKEVKTDLKAEIKQTKDYLKKEINKKHIENAKELAQIIRDNGKYEFEQRKIIVKRLDVHEKEIKKLKAKLA